MTNEYTRGSWHAVSDTYSYLIEHCDTGQSIGCIWSEHDARLVTAAPNLLEALENIVRLTKVQDVLKSWELGSLYTIIAKAKGKLL